MIRVIVLLLLWCGGAFGSIFSYVQSNSTTAATSLTFSSNVTAGDLIVVAVSYYSGSNYAVAVNGASPILLASSTFSNGGVQVFYLPNAAGGATTVTISGGTAADGGPSLAILEYTSTAAPTVLGLQGYLNTEYNPIQTFTAALTLPTSEMLEIVALYDTHSSHTWTGTNLTVRQETAESGGQTLVIADVDVSSGTDTTVRTLTGNTGNCYAVEAVFYNASSGGINNAVYGN